MSSTFRTRSPKVAVAAVAAVGLLAAGYGVSQAVSDDQQPRKADSAADGTADGEPSDEATLSEEEELAEAAEADKEAYEETLALGDGRTLHMRLVERTGLQARVKPANGGAWSAWRTVHASKEDRCQGIELEEVNGTVSFIADFGLYCSDGEPPQESLAGVGTGDLSTWQIDVTKDFDGWEEASVNDDGSKVLFHYHSDAGLYTLRWDQAGGFSPIAEPTP